MENGTHWMLAELAVREDLANRDFAGHGVRLCFHVDRTLTRQAGGIRAECDYCPAWAVSRLPGVIPPLDPFLLQESP